MIETTKIIQNLKLYGSVQNQLYAVHFEQNICTLKVQKLKELKSISFTVNYINLKFIKIFLYGFISKKSRFNDKTQDTEN